MRITTTALACLIVLSFVLSCSDDEDPITVYDRLTNKEWTSVKEEVLLDGDTERTPYFVEEGCGRTAVTIFSADGTFSAAQPDKACGWPVPGVKGTWSLREGDKILTQVYDRAATVEFDITFPDAKTMLLIARDTVHCIELNGPGHGCSSGRRVHTYDIQ